MGTQRGQPSALRPCCARRPLATTEIVDRGRMERVASGLPRLSLMTLFAQAVAVEEGQGDHGEAQD